MANLANVCAAIVAEVAALSGMAQVPNEPSEKLAVFPAAVVYPGETSWRLGSSDGGSGNPTMWGTSTIHIDVHVARKNLGADFRALIPFADSLPLALFLAFATDRIGSTVTVLGNQVQSGAPLRAVIEESSWNTQPTLAYRCEFDVTFEQEIV